MGTLIYAPAIKVAISTARNGVIDVTDDLTRGQLALIENAPSKLSVSLANHRRKYDGVFTPDDRVVVQMRRIGPFLQTFSGYLDAVPYISVYPRTVNITATCTLKRLQYHPWDPGAMESFLMIHSVGQYTEGSSKTDAGVKDKLNLLLTEVAGWPAEAIHIGRIPADWFDRLADVYMAVVGAMEAPAALLGSSPTVAGTSMAAVGQGSAIAGTVPGATGVLPASVGKASYFAGVGTHDATGHMALSGESGTNPTDPWYCAMRWPYVQSVNDPQNPTKVYLSSQDTAKAKAWWNGRRILVSNPKNGRSVVLRAADWGPYGALDRVIDMSQYALETVLGAHTDETVNIAFASEGAALGPYSLLAQATTATPLAGSTGSSLAIPDTANPTGAAAFAWGGYSNGRIPLTALIQIEPGKHLAPIAAQAYQAMRAEAVKAGVTLSVTSGYRSYDEQAAVKAQKGAMAAAPGSSNHGWGMAGDLDAGGGPGTKVYDWLAANGSRFGWVNPPWAKVRSGQYEPWHWEFWAALNATNTAALKTGGDALSQLSAALMVDSTPADTTAAGQPPATTPLNVFDWTGAPSIESELLAGARALMNDEGVLSYVQMLSNISMRSFMAAPNGDFIAWFPDYFGLYGLAGKMSIQDIEVQDFTVNWDDTRLITHQFVAGAFNGFSTGDPGGPVDIYQKFLTAGVVSVEQPEVMKALFHLEPKPGEFGDSVATLQRFGARPAFSAMGTITGSQAEFWYALFLFQRNWAEQFSTNMPLTFMPELFPGMLAQLPSMRFQAYVTQVVHSFDFSNGGGFRTSATIIAPSSMDGGLFRPPRGI